MIKWISLLTFITCALATAGCAQTSTSSPGALPAEYQALYTGLEATLDRYLTASAGKPVLAEPVFAASLLPANANMGLRLLIPSTATTADLMLKRFSELGLKGVTFDVNFPLLDPAYYEFMGQPADTVDKLVAFYEARAAVARQYGLKVIVESSQVFTNKAYSSLPVEDYYRTLDLATFEARRTVMFKLIAEALQPDWFTVAEESDTMQTVTGLPVDDPAVLIPMVGRFVESLKSLGLPNMKVGAGFGTWHPQWNSLAEGFLREAGVDFLNLHFYFLRDDQFARAVESARLARQYGKGLVVGEAWCYKTEGAEGINGATDATAFARDAFSFWAPLDEKFLQALALLGRSEGFEYLSPFWSTYFFGYLDYSPETAGLLPAQIVPLVNRTVASNLYQGVVSPTGEAWSALAKAPR